jgi:hypothetical protein
LDMHYKTLDHCEVIVTAPGLLHEMLAAAEATLRQAAMGQGKAGILVTRHDPHRYTLALDEAVPFGETRERSLL